MSKDLKVGDSVLLEDGKYYKITSMDDEVVILNKNKLKSKKELQVEWQAFTRTDNSGSLYEYEVGIVRSRTENSRPGINRIVLFSERSGIKPTKANLLKMTKAANSFKDIMNETQVCFED